MDSLLNVKTNILHSTPLLPLLDTLGKTYNPSTENQPFSISGKNIAFTSNKNKYKDLKISFGNENSIFLPASVLRKEKKDTPVYSYLFRNDKLFHQENTDSKVISNVISVTVVDGETRMLNDPVEINFSLRRWRNISGKAKCKFWEPAEGKIVQSKLKHYFI